MTEYGNLIEQLSKFKGQVNTRHELRSTTDIIQAYQDGSLLINPAYQRNYKWNNIQKTRFIESLLLRIPIPPVFVLETLNLTDSLDDSDREIIDGLQRISTILEFSKTLEDENNHNHNKLIKLEGAEILTELNGLSWSDFEDSNLLKRAFRNCTLLFSVIGAQDESLIVYETFKRLNSAGTTLDPQEIRIIYFNRKNKEKYKIFSDKFNSEFSPRIKTLLSKSKLEERKDMELFIEFSLIKDFETKFNELKLNIKSSDIKKIKFETILDRYCMDYNFDDIGDYLIDFDKFLTLTECSGYRKFDSNKQSFTGSFLTANFEILAFIFFIDKSLLNQAFIQNSVSLDYSKSEVGKGNPDALTRLIRARKYARTLCGVVDDNELF